MDLIVTSFMTKLKKRSQKLQSEFTYFVQAPGLLIIVYFTMSILSTCTCNIDKKWVGIIIYTAIVEYISWLFEEGDIGGSEYCNTTKKKKGKYHKTLILSQNSMLKPLLSISSLQQITVK